MRKRLIYPFVGRWDGQRHLAYDPERHGWPRVTMLLMIQGGADPQWTTSNVPLEDISPDSVVDLEEMGCGALVIALMKAMRPLAVGQVLEARAVDPGAEADVPSWCNMRGHDLLAGPCGEGDDLYYIRKGR